MRAHRLVFVTLILSVLVAIPGAAAQETRTGGNVIIGEDETVQGLTATGGTVTVLGTVDGDLTAAGGNIEVPGNVTGDATLIGGSITLSGALDRNVTAFGGYVELAETGAVGQTFSAAAGDVLLNGGIGEDARIDAERLQVGPTASIGRNLVHATDSLNLANNATVGGEIRSVDRVDVGVGLPMATNIPAWVFALYGFVINLVLGAVLLLVLPEFSFAVAAYGRDRPLASILVGLITVIVVPILLVLLAITIIGIPLALLGLLAFVIALWTATVYGAFTIGTAVLGAADRSNRWLALIAGLLIVSVLGAIPFLGGVIVFLVTLFGLGALFSAAT